MRPKDPGKSSRRPEHFDPDDLYRRLEKYQRELARAQEPRKGSRKAKAEKPTSPQQYRHVPQFAAADFVNTASPECLEKQEIHPLSSAAIRSSKPRGARSSRDAPMSHYVEKQDLALQQMMARADRNQFTRSPGMEAVAERDNERNLYKPPQRDFEPLMSPQETRDKPGSKLIHGAQSPALEPLDEIAEEYIAPMTRPLRPEDRCDWSQTDENVQPTRRRFKHHIFPSLRKTQVQVETKEPQLDASAQGKKPLRRRSTFLIF